tara:strand:+ start:530 stop:754 length:225 start_codon:yes stop_codon:yes gene_type:complete
MKKEKIKQIEKEQLVSIDNVVFEPMPKDKYEDERFNPEQDTIYLDKLGRTIEVTCIAFILLSLIGFIGLILWVK